MSWWTRLQAVLDATQTVADLAARCDQLSAHCRALQAEVNRLQAQQLNLAGNLADILSDPQNMAQRIAVHAEYMKITNRTTRDQM